LRTVFTPFMTIFGTTIEHHSEYSPLGQMNTILLIQERYNFRISEVLRLSSNCLMPDFNISVKLSKCTAYSIIRDEEIWNLLSEIFAHNINKSFTIPYKSYYWYLSHYHSNLIIRKKNGNNKVSHSFRYKKAQQLQSNDAPEMLIKAQLHHQSKKSQKYYLKP